MLEDITEAMAKLLWLLAKLCWWMAKLYWWMIKLCVAMMVATYGLTWWLCLWAAWLVASDKPAIRREINRFGTSLGRVLRRIV